MAAASYPVVTKPQKKATFPIPVPRKHYGFPPCLPGEVEQRLAGFDGTLCTSRCNATTHKPKCPQDSTAPGGGAAAACLLQNQATKHEYCALPCQIDCDCPVGEFCAMVSPQTGVCMSPPSGSAAPEAADLVLR